MIYKFYQLLDEMDDLVLKTIVSSSQKPISVAGEHIDLTNNQYHICFYNIYHFGDIFFTQPFVKHICDSNPNVIFYYWLLQGHAVYDGIPNLICLEHDNDISSSISEKKTRRIISFFTKNHNISCEIYAHLIIEENHLLRLILGGHHCIMLKTWIIFFYSPVSKKKC